jgi:universal stress protein E
MKQHVEKVLVAVKPWQGGLPISAYHARFLAEGFGAELRLMSCVFDSQVAVGLARSEARAIGAQAGLIGAERRYLEDLGHSLADWGGVVETVVRWGNPVEEVILDEVEAWEPDLLVVSAHQYRPVPHTRLTHVDWQLMRLCPCPLLLVKDPQFEGYPAILAGIDPLHRHAEPQGLDRLVLEAASRMAATFDATLCVGHAFPPPEAFALASAVEVLPGVLYGTENIEAAHREAVIELVANYGVAPPRVHLRPGRADEVLLELVREFDIKLLVLGSIKRSRLEQALLGSTAETVAADAECDLLLVGVPPSGRRPAS